MTDSTANSDDLAHACPACGGRIALVDGSTPAQCPHCEHGLWFVRRAVNGAVVATVLSGMLSSDHTMEQVDEAIGAAGGAPLLVFDLARLERIESSFLKMLVALRSKTQGAGPRLRICGLNAGASQAFRRTRLERIFDIRADQRSALADGGDSAHPG